jgi:hypothetical protein
MPEPCIPLDGHEMRPARCMTPADKAMFATINWLVMVSGTRKYAHAHRPLHACAFRTYRAGIASHAGVPRPMTARAQSYQVSLARGSD